MVDSNVVDTLMPTSMVLSHYLQEMAYHTHQVVGEEDQLWEHREPRDHSVVGEGRRGINEDEMGKNAGRSKPRMRRWKNEEG